MQWIKKGNIPNKLDKNERRVLFLFHCIKCNIPNKSDRKKNKFLRIKINH